MKILNKNKKGFTLIELVFYFFVVGGIIFVAVTFAIQIMKMSSLSGNYKELHTNADFIENKINFAIKTADSIDFGNSIFDNEEGVLSLNMNDPAKSPTKFSFIDGDIFLTEGSGTPLHLNSSLTNFNYFKINVVSFSKTPDQITIDAEMGLTHSDISDIDKSINIYLVSSLRKL
jgi:hypothetical protein